VAYILATVVAMHGLLLGCSSQGSSPPAPVNEVSTVAAPRSSTPTATGVNFCSTFLADQKAAAEAIGRAVRHPSTEQITMQDLQAARAKLQADVLLAPPDLKAHVQAQVDTLDDLIRRLLAGNIKGLDLHAFENAQKALIRHCRDGV
jgi:hypothetical protein